MARRIIPGKLRELRKAKGLSVTELARAINVSEVTVRTWEAGRYHPSPRNLSRLAEALGTPVEDFTANCCPACGRILPEES